MSFKNLIAILQQIVTFQQAPKITSSFIYTSNVIVLIILTAGLKQYYLGVYFYLMYMERQIFKFCYVIKSSLAHRGLKGLPGKQRS